VAEFNPDPYLPTAHFDRAGRYVVRPEIEGAATRKIEPRMMPVAGQNAVLHAATIKWKAHMRTPVVQGVHSILFFDDQDRSMRSVYQEPSFALEFLKRACTYEHVCFSRRCHWIHEQFGRIRLVLH
jgi:hypothetical protein